MARGTGVRLDEPLSKIALNKIAMRSVRWEAELGVEQMPNLPDGLLGRNTLCTLHRICDMARDVCKNNTPGRCVGPCGGTKITNQAAICDPSAQYFVGVWICKYVLRCVKSGECFHLQDSLVECRTPEISRRVSGPLD